MKRCRLPWLVWLLLGLVTSCTSVPNTAALRVGMTRVEAVAAMGEPPSVSAQGGFEYLNYMLSETSPSGYGSISRPYYVRLSEGKVQAFGFSDQINRTQPSAAATARARFAALRIGMSKDEAIAVMGLPASVSAQGNLEYLNYGVTETNASGMAMMRPYYVRLADGRVEAFGFSDQIGRASSSSLSPPSAPARTSGDSISLATLEPATLAAGQRQAVVIKIHYALNSREKAVVSLVGNTSEADFFRRIPGGEEVVTKGDGDVELKVNLTPVDWGNAARFKLIARLLDYPRVPGEQPFVAVEVPVPLAK